MGVPRNLKRGLRVFISAPLILFGLLIVLAFWQSVYLVKNIVPLGVVLDPEQDPDDVWKHPLVNNLTDGGLPTNQLVHVTVFGIGHRLCRTSAAWHLAKRLNLTRMKFQWKTCGENHLDGPPIFPYLFGNDTWEIENNENKPVGHGKQVLVRNDVFGYVSGQALKDFQVPLPKRYKDADGPFLEKLASDKELYRLMEDRYMFKNSVLDFMKEHDFQNHFVIGVHLRAGNGEQAHFVESGRGITNETNFVLNLVNSIGYFARSIQKSHPERFESRPPLIFLATDTGYLVDTFVQSMKKFEIPTILFPQLRLAKNEGVTFSALQGSGEKCLQGWQAMFSDMLLLGQSNVLIAARKSTFTQSLPILLVFDRFRDETGPHFCESSADANDITCFQDLETWLFRDDDKNIFSYSTKNESAKPVLHKLVLLLPDVEFPKDFKDVENFLHQNEIPQSVMTHTYGSKRFYQKYRNSKSTQLTAEFNILSN